MRSSDFDIEFRAKIDSYLREGVVVPVDGGFDAFCLAETFDKYALSHNVSAPEMIQIIKDVFNKRVLRLIKDEALGVFHTVDGLVDNLLVALSDFAADKQAKLSAASDPTLQGDAANAQFAGRTLASAVQSHPARADANGHRVSPAGSAAADDVADDRMDDEELPPANANPVINGLECPPPSSLLKFMLKGKTDPAEVMQLTSLYFREFNNRPSRYATDDDSTVSKISSKSAGKSTSKSRSPECFHGKPADHGYPAKSWIFAFQLYLAAEDEHNPVAKAATYLRGDALDWWQQSGYLSMPPASAYHRP